MTVYDATGAAVGLAGLLLRRLPDSSSSPSARSREPSRSAGRGSTSRAATRPPTRSSSTTSPATRRSSPSRTFPAGRQDVLVNGVARASGRNGTFFRTDARIYNPAGRGRDVTVAFHANQNANPNPAPRRRSTSRPGRILDVVDVLASLLGAARRLGRGAAVHVRRSRRDPLPDEQRGSERREPRHLRRTAEARADPLVPVVGRRGRRDGDPAGNGLPDERRFRRRGRRRDLFADPEERGGSGGGNASGSLGAWGWTQPNVQDLFPGVTIPDDATLQRERHRRAASTFSTPRSTTLRATRSSRRSCRCPWRSRPRRRSALRAGRSSRPTAGSR